jgi:dTDP-4-dehydrorhamnose 3,5-epimerase
MNITPLDIPDVHKIILRKFADDRGWFTESWRHNAFCEALGREITFVQDNHSFSEHKHTVRGLHFQTPPHAQGKLVRCTRGAVMDIAVDFRAGSPTYGKSVGEVLSAENQTLLWVPEGFLHGFATLTPKAEVQYKCSGYYAADCDANIAWNDPDLAIDWGTDHGFDPARAVVSKKDKIAPAFSNAESPFKD